jgi:hypothetical protein
MAAAEAFMALIGLSRSDTIEYVSDSDPCKKWIDVPIDPNDPSRGTERKPVIEEGATVFLIGQLDVFLMGRIYDQASTLTRNDENDEVGLKTNLNLTNIDAVRFGLRGWRNFRDKDGSDLPFATVKRRCNGRDYQVVTDACLKFLGIQLVQELAHEIKTRSEVSQAEEKNSGTAS